MNSNWIKYGALMAALAIVLGAFEMMIGRMYSTPDTNSIDAVETGVTIVSLELGFANRLQMLNACGLMVIGLLMQFRQNIMLVTAGRLLLLGTIGYGGSAYAYSATGRGWLQWIAVSGLVVLVIGWLALVEGACPAFKSRIVTPGNE